MSCKGENTACPNLQPTPGTAGPFPPDFVLITPTTPTYEVTDKSITPSHWTDLEKWQKELKEWHQPLFGDMPLGIEAAKVLEEAGELGHAVVRLWLAERNNAAAPHIKMFEDKLRDAIGDVVVTVTNLATRYGWSLATILQDVLAELKSRRYSDDKTSHGIT